MDNKKLKSIDIIRVEFISLLVRENKQELMKKW